MIVMERLEKVYRLLKDLPAQYRSAPFWAWNDALKPEELVRQIGDFNDRGIGGFFIHSREGLETEYLSEEWMNCVHSSVTEAGKWGMEAWIYDEDKWPSGSAGGAVSAAHPEEFTAKGLTAELHGITSEKERDSLLDTLSTEGSILGLYQLHMSLDNRESFTSFEVVSADRIKKNYQFPFNILICTMETSGSSEWYNNLAPSDNLNPKAVRCFIDKTHERYKERFQDKFGKSIEGFFTDEPNFCDFFSHFTPGRPWLPWSTVLPDFFMKQRGYSIVSILPFLFFHSKGGGKARYDYWLTLTELFTSSYTRQLYDWCSDNNLRLTGHVLYENDLGYSVRVSGASMPHYRYMHAPGIDILGDQRQEYLTVKQCTSVANQFDRHTILTETYGCTGWDFSFAGQKRVGDWQFIMGVNKRCQHLALYSLSGCRKRDYPPSFNYHTSWWQYDKVLEDYFARLAVCVSTGQVLRDILLIHPMASLWMKSGSTITEDLEHRQMNMGWLDNHILDLNKEGDSYNQLARRLLMSHFDFDFGDELIMKDEGSVEGDRIKIGNHGYKTIIVPSVETIMGSTLVLLESFLKGGGTIFWVRPLPELVEAVYSDRLKRLFENKGLIEVDSYGGLIDLLSKEENRPIQICDEYGVPIDGFLSMVRLVENGRIVTIVNTNGKGFSNIDIHFSTEGALRSFDPLSGKFKDEKVQPIEASPSEGMTLSFAIGPEESRVFFIDESAKPEFGTYSPLYEHPHGVEQVVMSFPYRSNVSLTTENALTLDRCQFSYNGGKTIGNNTWLPETSVWQGQKELREFLKMVPVYYNGAPQRYSWIDKNKQKAVLPVRMKFTFTVEEIPSGDVFVAIEKSRGFNVFCNNISCEITGGFFLDRALVKHRITSLHSGENSLEIEVDYNDSTELENIYIVGEFGVSPDRCLIATPKTLVRGDWTSQGLLHYSGSVRYGYSFPPLDKKWQNSELRLKVGDFAGTLAVIRINENDPFFLFHGESEIALSGIFSENRENNINIEIVGSLRNLLGPLHRAYSSCSRISWEDFRTEEELYSPEYIVQPMGLLGEVKIITES